jgi:hypothetical protein
MTHLSFTRANAIRPSLAGLRLANAGGLIPAAALFVRRAAAGVCGPVVILVSYRAALKRLEASVEGDLFDDPVHWAELKSVAWAEATRREFHIP